MPLAFLTADANPALIPLSLLVVFGSAKLMAEIFERLGQPGIVGEILAGVLIGPYALGWMAPNQILSVLSDLGVMFLLCSFCFASGFLSSRPIS
jgi:Kef-type K+ transport system membrane component KefB